MQCKFCIYQMQTAIDEKFWDKVCEFCGKIFSKEQSLNHWHRKLHTSNWKCDVCDKEFNRKWNLKRHLLEIHEIDIEDDSEPQQSDEDAGVSCNESENSSEIDTSDDDEGDESSGNAGQLFKCRIFS